MSIYISVLLIWCKPGINTSSQGSILVPAIEQFSWIWTQAALLPVPRSYLVPLRAFSTRVVGSGLSCGLGQELSFPFLFCCRDWLPPLNRRGSRVHRSRESARCESIASKNKLLRSMSVLLMLFEVDKKRVGRPASKDHDFGDQVIHEEETRGCS